MEGTKDERHAYTSQADACPACMKTVTSSSQHGVDCGYCGHHFHIGARLVVGEDPIKCPRCEHGTLPTKMKETDYATN